MLCWNFVTYTKWMWCLGLPGTYSRLGSSFFCALGRALSHMSPRSVCWSDPDSPFIIPTFLAHSHAHEIRNVIPVLVVIGSLVYFITILNLY